MDDIYNLRKELHRNPEVSHAEFTTSKRVKEFIIPLKPDKIIQLGNTGLAFVFKGKNKGQRLMFRADLDALPLYEINDLEYKSQVEGVAHLCGHDGHMSILAGLAKEIAETRPEKGEVVLLFQPAEEVGEGALAIVQNQEFQKIKPDFIFGLHNIPGFEKNAIILKKESFNAASKGMTVKLFGKTSHAAEPENGINPDQAISKIIQDIHVMQSYKDQFNDFALITVIHIQLGEIAFGTSPGYAEIRFTLRANEDKDMEMLTNKTESIIKSISETNRLRYEISYSEIFPANINDTEAADLIASSAKENKLSIVERDEAFKWSEDFGYYTQNNKGAFFGLGAGEKHPALHNPDYDFPEEIIKSGINLFYSIYKKINF